MMNEIYNEDCILTINRLEDKSKKQIEYANKKTG